MFDNLLAFLRNPGGYETPLPEADAQHAMGALLVRAAKADKTYLVSEIQRIDKVLARQHGLDPVAAAKMRAACEKLEQDIPDTVEIADILNNAIGTEDKEATLRALWSVAYADGIMHKEEDRLLHQIEAALDIPQERAKAIQSEAEAQNQQKIPNNTQG